MGMVVLVGVNEGVVVSVIVGTVILCGSEVSVADSPRGLGVMGRLSKGVGEVGAQAPKRTARDKKIVVNNLSFISGSFSSKEEISI